MVRGVLAADETQPCAEIPNDVCASSERVASCFVVLEPCGKRDAMRYSGEDVNIHPPVEVGVEVEVVGGAGGGCRVGTVWADVRTVGGGGGDLRSPLLGPAKSISPQ